ncbi:alpha-hydroxyketone-type quorum-sensing autoinducer synthase [Streptomyces iconiensis]|uniref:8-amino-7-oxononanoate synthase n=1 Tax=Streptomyces iconiensis TaxID=1384038 RepID=A0ABT7AAP0_9ACTN|nr:alpha-hydroxyketone-type quorum-sensing autoinducer synthase [Streptomyces iconiensis]MDJ1138381.1 quorum-sensing autoinducer CAI-1 synthase [Streptomyces iconiensis]
MPDSAVGLAMTRKRIDRFHRERKAVRWGGQQFLRGLTPGDDAVLVNSNDYLSLSRDPRIVRTMANCLTAHGNGVLMSGVFLTGEESEHPQLRLETELAAHAGCTAGVLCQSGWAANTGLLQATADGHTPVYMDMYAHMSLWEGARIAEAPVRPFLHNGASHLRRKIEDSGPGIVVVDAVYSNDGSVCPLREIAETAREYGCSLLVDESHSLGALGSRGTGMSGQLTGDLAPDFVTASLSKAFAGRAGFIGCQDPEFPEYFKFESFPAVFSSTLLPHDVAGLTAAMGVVRDAEDRRTRLAAHTAYLREELAAVGVSPDGAHIIALPSGDERRTMALRDALEAEGVFGAPFAPPATTRGRCFVRLSLHSELTTGDRERIVSACHRAAHLIG